MPPAEASRTRCDDRRAGAAAYARLRSWIGDAPFAGSDTSRILARSRLACDVTLTVYDRLDGGAGASALQVMRPSASRSRGRFNEHAGMPIASSTARHVAASARSPLTVQTSSRSAGQGGATPWLGDNCDGSRRSRSSRRAKREVEIRMSAFPP
jgi:hypothetical protein